MGETPPLRGSGCSHGFHSNWRGLDALGEADALAHALFRFVGRPIRSLDTGETRLADWSDCVVLLRSARYKSDLTTAFLRRGIPFRMDTLPEHLYGLRQAWIELLTLLAAWKVSGLTPETARDPQALSDWLASPQSTPLALGDRSRQSPLVLPRSLTSRIPDTVWELTTLERMRPPVGMAWNAGGGCV